MDGRRAGEGGLVRKLTTAKLFVQWLAETAKVGLGHSTSPR